MRKKEALWFYLLVFPWVFGFIVLTLGPMIYSFFLSLTNWDLFTPPQFVGWDNYIRLFTKDKIFWKTVFNTLYYAFISVPLGMLFSLFIAYFLNRPIKGSAIYRTLYYIPATVPGVASALLFRWLLAPDAGMINRFLAIFGVDGPAWLLEPDWVKPALILMSLWVVGANITLLMAGMKSIPGSFMKPPNWMAHLQSPSIIGSPCLAYSGHLLQSDQWLDRRIANLHPDLHYDRDRRCQYGWT